ncbi:hypothetical protein ACFQRL_01315 [Microbacterium fluvii]|uniref:Fibrinogen-binding protein n=1 Tax=Microbacterium fluvii TaxID=415215 RepID=A0ABW2HAW1_9MICO|nr:hypothetical protein [Microbacterium fluvii]MCU4671226.1 hypothetical protein [Microbacterium fluvii]
MVLDYNDLDDSFNNKVKDSLNTTNTTNTANLQVGLENVGNTDNSVNDSGNAAVDVSGSGNVDSNDFDLDVDLKVRDSFNDNSDNSTDDHTDNSMNDSGNDSSDNSVNGSYNSWIDGSTDDNSVNAGVRSYNTGFGDFAGAGGGSGTVDIDNRATIVDQSINGNVDGSADIGSYASAVVGSGDGSLAAGGSVSITTSLDESTNISAGGDVNMGNTTTVTSYLGSFNTETDNSQYTDGSVVADISDSFNDNSTDYTADNSFNSELSSISQSDWDVDANVIWGSDVAVIADDDPAADMPDM